MAAFRIHWLIAFASIAPAVCAGRDLTPLPIPEEPAMVDPAPELPSATGAEYTLDDFIAIAFQNNPTLAIASARMESARGRQIQAGLYPNPVVGYQGNEMGNFGTPGQQGGFISQRFITAGKLKLDRAAAGKEIDDAHFRFHAQEQRVATDVRMRFYEALAAQRRVEVAEQLAKIGDNLVAATEKLLTARLRTENDLLQARIKADEAHIVLDNSANELFEAWQRLMAVAGTPEAPMATLNGDLTADLTDRTWDDCCQLLFAGHPELNAAQARVERARLLIARAKKEPIPNVDLSVGVRHSFPSDYNVANVDVAVPIPIFNRNQGNIRAAEAEWVAACNEVRRIELELQDRLAVAYRRYANGREQALRYSGTILPRADRSLALVTNGYEKGQVEYLTLLTVQQTYLQVNLAYIASLRELRSAAALIDGQLLDGSLGTMR